MLVAKTALKWSHARGKRHMLCALVRAVWSQGGPKDPHWVDFQSVSLDVCHYPPTALVSCGNN
jgi:hypothetical protein